MGAFIYFFLILTLVPFIGLPLVLFQLMLEGAPRRSEGFTIPPSVRALGFAISEPPPSSVRSAS